MRAQSAYDPRSREQFVIAQVDDPYGKSQDGHPPLKINQFVKAQIQGALLEDVVVIPRSALRNHDEVILIDSENKISRRMVEVIWKQGEQVIIQNGLEANELLCLTPLVFAADGAEVRPIIEGEPSTPPEGKRNRVHQGPPRGNRHPKQQKAP